MTEPVTPPVSLLPPVSSIARDPCPSLQALVDRLKERIDAGDVRGLLVLIACPGRHFARLDAGEYEIGTLMHAFEDWKHAEMKASE